MLLQVDKTKYVNEAILNNELLQQKDLRMRFNNAQDPIYFAFEMLERRSVVALVGDLIEDTCYEISKAVSKLTK